MRPDQWLRKSSLTINLFNILRESTVSRNSDVELWLNYMETHHNLKALLGPVAFAQLASVLRDKRTPSFESITRARRKIQEHYPELKGMAAENRREIQESVRDWAVNTKL
jgi:hypothetical protein